MSDVVHVVEALLTRETVAELLGVSVGTVDNLARSGRLRSVHLAPPKIVRAKRHGKLVDVRIGGAVRFDPADVRAFIEASKGTPERTADEGGTR